MLILTRKRGQSIVVDGEIEVTLLQIQGDQVRLGITAPKRVTVHRKELLEQVRAENVEAAGAGPQQARDLSQALVPGPAPEPTEAPDDPETDSSGR
jgi:carbon storage regulator